MAQIDSARKRASQFSQALTITMNEYRVTKYNPENRNDHGHYLDKEEWTEFCEVGKKVSLEEYTNIETAYIESAVDFISGSGIREFKVVALEDSSGQSKYKDNDVVPVAALESVIRSLLRGEFWCRLESDLGFIHVGWDYYMYVGVSSIGSSAIERAQNRGLFVETFNSPYHPENC